MILTTNTIQLYYEKSGIGRPLILLHGNGETHHIFDSAVAVLKQHFTVYTLDTRGHGESSAVSEYHYADMAQDVYDFITALQIEKPILYGFSDGGIVGLKLAIQHPNLLSALVASGANTKPSGLKRRWLWLFKLIYTFTRSSQYKLMVTEPDIADSMLHQIQIPVHLTAGGRDMISDAHTLHIHENIIGSTLKVFKGETHSSYILKGHKLADYLLEQLLSS